MVPEHLFRVEPNFPWRLDKTQSASPASAHGGQDNKNSLSEFCAKVRHPVSKLSNKQFTKLKIPDPVHRPTAAAVAGQNCF